MTFTALWLLVTNLRKLILTFMYRRLQNFPSAHSIRGSTVMHLKSDLGPCCCSCGSDGSVCEMPSVSISLLQFPSHYVIGLCSTPITVDIESSMDCECVYFFTSSKGLFPFFGVIKVGYLLIRFLKWPHFEVHQLTTSGRPTSMVLNPQNFISQNIKQLPFHSRNS